MLTLTIPPGSGGGGGAIVDEWFSAATNLYGSTIVAQVALEMSRAQLPVNVRLYTLGDSASNDFSGPTATLAASTLSDLDSFHEIILRPSDRQTTPQFCASAVSSIGIQVQRSRSTSVEIPVKLYIKSVVVGTGVERDRSAFAAGGNQGHGGAGFQASVAASRSGGQGGDGYCQLADTGAISVAADDWVAAGTCQGYGYTYAYGTRPDTKVVPTCDARRCTPPLSKISAKALCASGTIAADSSWKSRAGVGFDFDPAKAKTSGIILTYLMAGTAILRFQLDDGNGHFYCVDLEETDENGSTLHLPWSLFATRCWDRWDPGLAFNPNLPIKGMQLMASCLATKNSWFDMCITGLATF